MAGSLHPGGVYVAFVWAVIVMASAAGMIVMLDILLELRLAVAGGLAMTLAGLLATHVLTERTGYRSLRETVTRDEE